MPHLHDGWSRLTWYSGPTVRGAGGCPLWESGLEDVVSRNVWTRCEADCGCPPFGVGGLDGVVWIGGVYVCPSNGCDGQALSGAAALRRTGRSRTRADRGAVIQRAPSCAPWTSIGECRRQRSI